MMTKHAIYGAALEAHQAKQRAQAAKLAAAEARARNWRATALLTFVVAVLIMVAVAAGW